MTCPFCQHPDSRVVDSRETADGIRRRRECESCGKRFSTVERVEQRLPQVVKKDGTRETYDRDKVRSGLALALRKRPVSAEQLDAAAARIETRAWTEAERGEISSRRVGALVLDELKNLDGVAFLRFASVYHELTSPEAFAELIRPLLKERE